jgi:hypothetical protein
MTPLTDEVLQTDVLGRVRTKRSRREALLDEFERGGASAQAVSLRRQGKGVAARAPGDLGRIAAGGGGAGKQPWPAARKRRESVRASSWQALLAAELLRRWQTSGCPRKENGKPVLLGFYIFAHLILQADRNSQNGDFLSMRPSAARSAHSLSSSAASYFGSLLNP